MSIVFPETFLCKLIDCFSSKPKKFENNEQNRHLHYDVYDPIFKKIQPYFRNYEETNELKRILCECREHLYINHEIVNPVHITRIDRIIDNDGNLKKKQNFTKKDISKYSKASEAKKKEYDYNFRKDSFYLFIHFFLIECNHLRKSLHLAYTPYLQRLLLDEISSNDFIGILSGLQKTILIFGAILIILKVLFLTI